MIPPKYSFYTGKMLGSMHFYKGISLSDNGEIIIIQGETDRYASDLVEIDSSLYSYVYTTVDFTNKYSAIFFYNSSEEFISMRRLVDISNKLISIPADTKYFAFRMSISDAAVKNIIDSSLEFIYALRVCNPHYKDLNKKYAKENGQYFFRESLDGKLSMYGDDYLFIQGLNIEDKLLLLITKYSLKTDSDYIYYTSFFNKVDCKFDHYIRKCELESTGIDDYTNILSKYEDTYDLIKIGAPITQISMSKRPVIQVYIKGSNVVSNFFGYTYWETEVNSVINDDDALQNTYYFAYTGTCDEIYVEGAGIPEVNSVYAGRDGEWISIDRKYRCYATGGIHNEISVWHVIIERISDGTVLYKSSEQTAYFGLDELGQLFSYISITNVENPSDTFTVSTVFMHKVFARKLCDVDSVISSNETIPTYNLPVDDFVSDNGSYKKCIGTELPFMYCTSYAVPEPTKYGLNDYGAYFSDSVIPTTTGLGRALPICKSAWVNASIWFVYSPTYFISEKNEMKQIVIKDNYSISGVIKALLRNIDKTITHEETPEYSSFLYGESSPLPGMSKFFVFIAPKSNVLKGEYDQPAQKAEITLKSVMDMLCKCFKCYWFIENKKLKIEHVDYFINGHSYDSNSGEIQYDFSTLKDRFNRKLSLYAQSEIEYNKADLVKKYEFSWADDSTETFDNVNLYTDSYYAQECSTESVTPDKFSADVDLMMVNPSNFSEDGFALLCPIKEDGMYRLPILEISNLVDENENNYRAYIQNAYASWVYLINFYLYDAPSYNMVCNAVSSISVKGIKSFMKHSIKFVSEEDPDELYLIKTIFGTGSIDEMSIDFSTRQAKINLLYRPQ